MNGEINLADGKGGDNHRFKNWKHKGRDAEVRFWCADGGGIV